MRSTLVHTVAARTFVYIDGESHYIRALHSWRSLHGDDATLEELCYREQPGEGLVLVKPLAKVFWTRKMSPGSVRATYFTAFSGDETAMHGLRTACRTFGLDSYVVAERKDRKARRDNIKVTQHLIEKAKGVDISLAASILMDAHHDAFDVCHLYTSDVDFLPVIEAVRSWGKQVLVFGFKNGLSCQSPLEYAGDLFTDIEEIFKNDCVHLSAKAEGMRD